eukprot:1144205-Pelagomonas_calceolata.AAC.2
MQCGVFAAGSGRGHAAQAGMQAMVVLCCRKTNATWSVCSQRQWRARFPSGKADNGRPVRVLRLHTHVCSCHTS